MSPAGEPPPSPPVQGGAGWYMVAALLIWSSGHATLQSGDLWWHLSTGRWIAEQWSIPLVDSWSYTEVGHSWLNHEWLADFMLHGWVSSFGKESLVYWKWLSMGLAYLVLMRVVHRLHRSPIAAYLAISLASWMSGPWLGIEPELLGLIGYSLLLHMTLLGPRPAWSLCLLFMVWANLHAGVVFGLIVLALILLTSPHPDLESRERAIGVWIGCMLASVLNPCGPMVLVYPFRYAAGSVYREVLEHWQPMWEVESHRAAPFLLLVVIFLASAAVTSVTSDPSRPAERPLTGVLLGLLTLAMTLVSRRFAPLFAHSAVLVIAPALGVVLPALARSLSGGQRRLTRSLLLPAAAVLGILRLVPFPLGSRAFEYLTLEFTFPVDTMNYMVENGLAGKVFTAYHWGGFVLYRSEGRLKVFVDGRADTLYRDGIFIRYLMVKGLEPKMERVLESHGTDFVLWPRQYSPLIQKLEESGRWRVIHRDSQSILACRKDLALPEPLRPAPDSPARRVTSGQEALDRKDLVEAQRQFNEALAMNPHYIWALRGLALIHAAGGQVDLAWTYVHRMQRAFPDRSQLEEFENLLKRPQDPDFKP